jgi:hypothetical protein
MDYVQTSKSKAALWKFVKVGSVASVENDILPSDDSNAAMYDLQGRRVTAPLPGIYLRGQKKVVITAQ